MIPDWELKVISKSEVDGHPYYRLMDPMGYEQWLSQEEYDLYLTNRKKRLRKENLDNLIGGESIS